MLSLRFWPRYRPQRFFSYKYRVGLAFLDQFATDRPTVFGFHKIGVENTSFPHFWTYVSHGVVWITACFSYVNVKHRIRSAAPRKSDR